MVDLDLEGGDRYVSEGVTISRLQARLQTGMEMVGLASPAGTAWRSPRPIGRRGSLKGRALVNALVESGFLGLVRVDRAAARCSSRIQRFRAEAEAEAARHPPRPGGGGRPQKGIALVDALVESHLVVGDICAERAEANSDA